MSWPVRADLSNFTLFYSPPHKSPQPHWSWLLECALLPLASRPVAIQVPLPGLRYLLLFARLTAVILYHSESYQETEGAPVLLTERM